MADGRATATLRDRTAEAASRPHRGPRRERICLLAGLLLLAAAATLPLDCPLAAWCLADHSPRLLRDLFRLAEPFGHGLGVLLILTALFQLDPARRGAIPRVVAMAGGSGLAADLIKLIVARTRPHHFDFSGGVAATFQGWLPLGGEGSGGQSFPSAHTATAVGLAFALAWLYPPGRWLFATLALLVACQRIEGGAHYLSDTLAGAAVGSLVAAACLHSRRLDRCFQRWEGISYRSEKLR